MSVNCKVFSSNAYISSPACLFPLLLIFYFIKKKKNVCKAVKNKFCLREISHVIFSQHHHVATVDSQNDLSYIIQCIDMLTDLF
jgi:hypothetical protein